MESGTVEQTLPGLGAPDMPSASVVMGRAIGVSPTKRLMIVSGRSNPDLAAQIAKQIGCELGETTLKTFASGETYCRYEDSIRGADIFIVQTASMPVDQHLMELLIMINAAKLASAKRITAVIPWYFYVRQDKKSRPREPITAKLVADLLQTAGADRVLTMDLHAGQVQGFFEIPVDHMTAIPLFAQYVRDLNLGEGLAIVSPDTGHAKIAGKFAEMVAGDLVILNKVRPAHNEAKVTTVIGDVEGKVAVIIDDIIDTAGTLVAGARALREAGATKVYACATHGLFNGEALQRIADSDIHKLVVTDTVPLDPLRQPDNIQVLSIAGILAETIHNVFADDSVSAIFAGENQLFEQPAKQRVRAGLARRLPRGTARGPRGGAQPEERRAREEISWRTTADRARGGERSAAGRTVIPRIRKFYAPPHLFSTFGALPPRAARAQLAGRTPERANTPVGGTRLRRRHR